MKYYSVLKITEPLSYEKTWVKFKYLLLSERIQKCYILYDLELPWWCSSKECAADGRDEGLISYGLWVIAFLLFINCNKCITLVGDVDNKKFGYICLGFPGGPLGKESACNAGVKETRFQSPSWEDSLEEVMAAYSSILAWRIPWTEEPGEQQSMGL